ncbi:hypothetical protein ABPG75_000465 [Micractinium tetrahymenae]
MSRATIDVLPDAVLTRILEISGFEQGPRVSLVSKRWRSLFFDSTQLWHSVRIAPPKNCSSPQNRSAAKGLEWLAAVLRRVSSLVSTASLELDSWVIYPNGSSFWEGEATLLRALPPGLQELSLCCDVYTEGGEPPLPPLPPQPTALHLGLWPLRQQAATWLAQLPRLEALSWRCNSIDVFPRLRTLSHLTRLTSLELALIGDLPGRRSRFLQGLAKLIKALPSALRELTLSGSGQVQRGAELPLPPLPPHLTRLCLGDVLPQPQAAAWLAQLPRLEVFSWQTDTSRQASALANLTSLTALELQLDVVRAGHHLQNAAAAIASLTRLRCLRCEARAMPAELAAAAARLPQLTFLELGGLSAGPPLAPLAALAQLRHLRLRVRLGDGDAAPQALPLPSAFAELCSFSFAAGGQDGVAAGPDQPLLELAGARLSSCNWRGEGQGSLVITGLAGLSSFAQLLGALCRPAGDAPLRRLHLTCCELPAGAMEGCPPLPHLTWLHLERCTSGGGTPLSGDAVGSLLRAAPRLATVCLSSCCDGALPDALTASRGLRLLELTLNRLTDLPPGPWLADLRHLSLSFNAFTRLPAGLASAYALEALQLTGNGALDLGPEDADLLAKLKALTDVTFVGRWVGSAFRERLAAVAPWIGLSAPAERAPCRPMPVACWSSTHQW